MTSKNPIANFVKYSRNQSNFSQQELAQRAGVGLRFLRDLEQGKHSLRIDKVNQVLALFGQQVSYSSVKLQDPYDILLNSFEKPVKLFMKDKTAMEGMLVNVHTENGDIKSWGFVNRKDITGYKLKPEARYIEVVNHNDIDEIENF